MANGLNRSQPLAVNEVTAEQHSSPTQTYAIFGRKTNEQGNY
jgi:hypothetical protein